MEKFLNIFNSLVLLATLLVIIPYTYETHCLRNAAVEANILSFRPILAFDADKAKYTVHNLGYGPALNSSLIVWDGRIMKATIESDMPGIVPQGGRYVFSEQEENNPAILKKKLPGFSSLIDKIIATQHPLFCVIYRDLAGNHLYSTTYGRNAKYEDVFEHGMIENH